MSDNQPPPTNGSSGGNGNPNGSNNGNANGAGNDNINSEWRGRSHFFIGRAPGDRPQDEFDGHSDLVLFFISATSNGMSSSFEKASDRAIRSFNRKRLDDLPGDDHTCIICYEPLKEPEDFEADLAAESALNDHSAVEMPCGHIFGLSCLRSWLSSAKSCPMCRAKVESRGEYDVEQQRANMDSNPGARDDEGNSGNAGNETATPTVGGTGPGGGVHSSARNDIYRLIPELVDWREHARVHAQQRQEMHNVLERVTRVMRAQEDFLQTRMPQTQQTNAAGSQSAAPQTTQSQAPEGQASERPRVPPTRLPSISAERAQETIEYARRRIHEHFNAQMAAARQENQSDPNQNLEQNAAADPTPDHSHRETPGVTPGETPDQPPVTPGSPGSVDGERGTTPNIPETAWTRARESARAFAERLQRELSRQQTPLDDMSIISRIQSHVQEQLAEIPNLMQLSPGNEGGPRWGVRVFDIGPNFDEQIREQFGQRPAAESGSDSTEGQGHASPHVTTMNISFAFDVESAAPSTQASSPTSPTRSQPQSTSGLVDTNTSEGAEGATSPSASADDVSMDGTGEGTGDDGSNNGPARQGPRRQLRPRAHPYRRPNSSGR